MKLRRRSTRPQCSAALAAGLSLGFASHAAAADTGTRTVLVRMLSSHSDRSDKA